MQGYLLLLSAINGFTADETASGEQAGAGGGPAGGDGQSQQEMAAMFAGYMGALPAEHFPNLRELAGEFSLADDGERFELLLDIFVDGLGRRARSGGR